MAVLSDGSRRRPSGQARRLPGITQRKAARRDALGRGTDLEAAHKTAPRWAVLGSRLSTPNAFGGCPLTELPSYKAAPSRPLDGSFNA